MSISSDYDLHISEEFDVARGILLALSVDVEAEEATGFNPSGFGGNESLVVTFPEGDPGDEAAHTVEADPKGSDSLTTTTEDSRSYTQSETTGPRLALLQLAIASECYVVDALRLRDLEPLSAVVANADLPVLLHGAGADLRVMSERGLHVAHYFDLEATSRSIFGQHESSLAAMLQRAFNTRLDKTLQRTDWTRRPLPPAMIAYAARDAEMGSIM